MTEPKNEEKCARPGSGRAFLSCDDKSSSCIPFGRAIAIPPLKAQLTFWSLMVLGLVLDLWSKKAAFDWLSHQQTNSISIINGFLVFVEELNPGAAFGIAAGQRFLLISVSLIALVVIFGIFLYSGNERRLIHVALGLFAAGVCGNLYDRAFNDGMVRDFIDVIYWPGRHWPAF
ncbi:MAG: signal peptidase II, partial [Planctomycetota bacterium]